jgi:ParB-like chromosome segregation protein Spo0J
MTPKRVKITEIKVNPSNPRTIKDEKFKKLVKSIQDFPEMSEIRPIVVNRDMVILGGNMRFKAMKDAGWKDVPVIVADNLTPEQEREFLIKDNTSGGEWDWEMLAMDWDASQLEEWGMDLPKFAEEPDYSILDDEDLSDQLNDMADGVKKSIQIEFEQEHYEEAYALVKFWRERNAYVGSMIMEYLKAEKDKL